MNRYNRNRNFLLFQTRLGLFRTITFIISLHRLIRRFVNSLSRIASGVAATAIARFLVRKTVTRCRTVNARRARTANRRLVTTTTVVTIRRGSFIHLFIRSITNVTRASRIFNILTFIYITRTNLTNRRQLRPFNTRHVRRLCDQSVRMAVKTTIINFLNGSQQHCTNSLIVTREYVTTSRTEIARITKWARF